MEGSQPATMPPSYPEHEHILPVVIPQLRIYRDPNRPPPNEDPYYLQQLLEQPRHDYEVRTAPTSIPWVPTLCILNTSQPTPHVFEAHANYVCCLLCTYINSLYKEQSPVKFYSFVTQIAGSRAPRD